MRRRPYRKWKLKKALFATVVAGSLAACAPLQEVTDVPPVDIAAVNATECVIVTGVRYTDTAGETRPVKVLAKSNNKRITLQARRGSNFVVASIAPGTYRITGVETATGSASFEDNFTFECEAGKVTYIGHMGVMLESEWRRLTMQFYDYSLTTEREFAVSYPAMAATNKMSTRMIKDPRQSWRKVLEEQDRKK